MDSWGLFAAAFAAVIIQAKMNRKNSPDWYMGCIIPLLYGGAVAWMFVGEELIRFLQIMLFGTAIPITLCLSAWLRRREKGPEEEGENPRTDP